MGMPTVREAHGDIWALADSLHADAICIPSNASLKTNGCAVMGAGIAKQARDRYKDVDRVAGIAIKMARDLAKTAIFDSVFHKRAGFAGAEVSAIKVTSKLVIVMFPTKLLWWDKSILELIVVSAQGLAKLVPAAGWETVLLPRPGCGCGGLEWPVVKKAIMDILPDEVIVVTDR